MRPNTRERARKRERERESVQQRERATERGLSILVGGASPPVYSPQNTTTTTTEWMIRGGGEGDKVVRTYALIRVRPERMASGWSSPNDATPTSQFCALIKGTTNRKNSRSAKFASMNSGVHCPGSWTAPCVCFRVIVLSKSNAINLILPI